MRTRLFLEAVPHLSADDAPQEIHSIIEATRHSEAPSAVRTRAARHAQGKDEVDFTVPRFFRLNPLLSVDELARYTRVGIANLERRVAYRRSEGVLEPLDFLSHLADVMLALKALGEDFLPPSVFPEDCLWRSMLLTIPPVQCVTLSATKRVGYTVGDTDAEGMDFVKRRPLVEHDTPECFTEHCPSTYRLGTVENARDVTIGEVLDTASRRPPTEKGELTYWLLELHLIARV